MFYFTTIAIEDQSGKIVEKAIRSYALKRHTSLDFKTSSGYIGEEKFFLGLETEQEIFLTRLRTPFERIIPKLIVRFKKDKQFLGYQVRLSVLSTLVLCLLAFGIFADVLAFIEKAETLEGLLAFVLIIVVYIALVLLELGLTRNRIAVAVRRTSENELFVDDIS